MEGHKEGHKEANEYVESVMVPENLHPVPVNSGRKRHLLLPEDSCIEKLKKDSGSRDIKKARRLIYDKNDRDISGKEAATGELTEDKENSTHTYWRAIQRMHM